MYLFICIKMIFLYIHLTLTYCINVKIFIVVKKKYLLSAHFRLGFRGYQIYQLILKIERVFFFNIGDFAAHGFFFNMLFYFQPWNSWGIKILFCYVCHERQTDILSVAPIITETGTQSCLRQLTVGSIAKSAGGMLTYPRAYTPMQTNTLTRSCPRF